jgi:hypothetical protein
MLFSLNPAGVVHTLSMKLQMMDVNPKDQRRKHMLTSRRVILATFFGLVFGFVCMWLASAKPDSAPMATHIKLNLVMTRMLTGFMIGISALKLKWYLHGMILGAIGSIPMAMATMPDPTIALSALVMGVVYGVLIELLTSIVFRAKPVGSP